MIRNLYHFIIGWLWLNSFEKRISFSETQYDYVVCFRWTFKTFKMFKTFNTNLVCNTDARYVYFRLACTFCPFICCYHFDITVSWWTNNNQTIDAALFGLEMNDCWCCLLFTFFAVNFVSIIVQVLNFIPNLIVVSIARAQCMWMANKYKMRQCDNQCTHHFLNRCPYCLHLSSMHRSFAMQAIIYRILSVFFFQCLRCWPATCINYA